MTKVDDKQILAWILSDDHKNMGYRCLISQYKEKLYWHIRRMVGNHDDADDVLQNTFLKVVKNIQQFQQNATLLTWIYRISTNEAITFIQTKNKRNHHVVVDQAHHLVAHESPEAGEVLHKLDVAIQKLPEKQKLVFNLRYYDELSYEAIAEITETSVGALKASYHHALKKIESSLIATV